MIGIVVVTHGHIGCEMVAATKRIIPEANHLIGVAVDSNISPSRTKEQIREAMTSVNNGNGLILLTDMFGGTPSNICLSFLDRGKVEVVSGCNLPMLIKIVRMPLSMKLMEVVTFIQQYGQKNIVIASEVLSQTKRRKKSTKNNK